MEWDIVSFAPTELMRFFSSTWGSTPQAIEYSPFGAGNITSSSLFNLD
jgi:hypothetical protein